MKKAVSNYCRTANSILQTLILESLRFLAPPFYYSHTGGCDSIWFLAVIQCQLLSWASASFSAQGLGCVMHHGRTAACQVLTATGWWGTSWRQVWTGEKGLPPRLPGASSVKACVKPQLQRLGGLRVVATSTIGLLIPLPENRAGMGITAHPTWGFLHVV